MAASKQSANHASDEQRWQAVVARDATADAQFVYAVASTGIYCKPSCAARLPRRDNVVFYSSCDAAEQAGFRACKRCRPNAPDLSVRQRDVIERVCRLIENSDEPLSLDALAQQAAMSRFHFQRTFKKIVGITPKQFQQAVRSQHLQHSLRHGESITRAIYAAGYGSSGHFYADAQKILGMQPQRIRRGGAGIDICYGIAPSALGLLLVAATEKGICRIELGSAEHELTNALRRDFPHAQLLPMHAQVEAWLREIVQFIEHPQQALQLPLDIQGTAFQRQVWQALRDIPLGATASYTEIAARIGKPNAVRAVATACARNHLALAIPCHRVIRSNGELAGYRWGIERKRELLRREAAQAPSSKSKK